jgi:carnosine synthase
MVAEGVIAKFLPVDMGQTSDQIYEQAQRYIKSLGTDGKTGAADGICTFVELSVPLVARLTESLGLPGHRPVSVDSARNKHATRAALKAAGLPTPRNYLIRTEADLDAARDTVMFPAVLKPVSGAASLGVKKVSNASDLKSTWKEIVDELSSLVVSSGALVKATPGGQGVKASANVDLTVLMEQYLDGPEVDVDVVMSNGEWVYAGVSDNGPTLEPYFNETWAVAPSLLPKEQQVALKELSVSSVKAMGFTTGVFHVECKYTSTGPQLIEVNARMGGGQVHECNLRTWGVELVEETIFSALGIPARPPVPKKPLSAVAYCYVNAGKSGKAKDLQGLEELLKRDNVVWAKPLVKPGDDVVGPAEGLPTWLADLFVIGNTPKEALDFLLGLQAEQPVKVV